MGKVKYSIEDCKNIAAKKDGECLSKEYKNAVTKILWRCKAGHEWLAVFDSVLHGSWCKICAGCMKLTLEDCRKLAAKKGGECLSNEYINNNTKMLWKCKIGHEWWAKTSNIKSGRWCPWCCRKGGAKPKNLCGKKFWSLTALEICGKRNTEALWKCICDCGNIIKVRSGHLKEGKPKSCGKCEIGIKSLIGLKVNKLKAVAFSHRGKHGSYWKCVCDCGEEIIVHGKTLKRGGKTSCGCNRRLDISNKVFGRLTVKEYLYTDEKDKCAYWLCECSCGNTKIIKATNLKDGAVKSCGCLKHWTQDKLANIVSEIVNIKYVSDKRFMWMKRPDNGNRMEIDIFFKDIGLAIEYDGIQHFEPIEHFGGLEAFIERKKRDKMKNELAKKAIKDGNLRYFIRFNYKDKIDTEMVKKRLKKEGVI